ncbi:MAG: glycosyltransferase family 4 protein [Chitinophagales bacterium]|nr:glycosyltransferase family 4 protein [Chitinophagales bacterium]
MKIGVWIPDKYLNSVHIYYEQVSNILTKKDVQIFPFNKNDSLPDEVDLYWDPTCTGGKNPNRRFLNRKKPLVATVHGASNFALPHHYTYYGWMQQVKGYWINFQRKLFWNLFRNNIEGIITVSHFAKEEIVRELNLNADKIKVIYHSYDKTLFRPLEKRSNDFLLHVSVFQPIKNIDTLLKAYREISIENKLPLVLIVPGFKGDANISGVQLIDHPISQQEVAKYMQNAKAFILPSFRESFGLPLIEAMACGTPIITSYGSATEEISKDVAILCRPHQMEDWKIAMEQIMSNKNLWNELHKRGIDKAQDFSWEKSATAHLNYFQSLINKSSLHDNF